MALPQLNQQQLTDLLNSAGTYTPQSGYAGIVGQYGYNPGVSTDPLSMGNYVPPGQNNPITPANPLAAATTNPLNVFAGNTATSKLVPQGGRVSGAGANLLDTTGGLPSDGTVSGLPGTGGLPGTTGTAGTTTSTVGGPSNSQRPAPNNNPTGLLTNNPAINNAILAALNALTGAFSNRPTTETNTGTVSTTPNLAPGAQNIIDQGGDIFSKLASDPDLSGYLANQQEALSKSTTDQENSLESILASHGITAGPASVAPMLNAENSKFQQNVQLQNQIPLLAKQLQQQTLSAGGSFLNAIPHGDTTTTDTTKTTSGNQLGGALTGLTGLLTLLSTVNSQNGATKNPLTVNNYTNSSSTAAGGTGGAGGSGGGGGTTSGGGHPVTINLPGTGLPPITINLPTGTGGGINSGGPGISNCYAYDSETGLINVVNCDH